MCIYIYAHPPLQNPQMPISLVFTVQHVSNMYLILGLRILPIIYCFMVAGLCSSNTSYIHVPLSDCFVAMSTICPLPFNTNQKQTKIRRKTKQNNKNKVYTLTLLEYPL